jgi:ABC-2 type transport system permease protein
VLDLKPFYHIYLIMMKDLTEFYRIKSRLVAMILFPVILMVMFGYMFPSGGGIKHIPLIVVEQDVSPTGMALEREFVYSAQSQGYFKVNTMTDLSEAINQMTLGNTYGIVIFNRGVGQQIDSTGHADIEVILDQLNPTLDQSVRGEVSLLFTSITSALTPSFQSGMPPTMPLTVNIQFEGIVPGATSSFEFLAPGMIAMSLIIGGLSGLAMTFSREKELGTLDGLLMSPISRLSIILGKGFAQVVRGLVGASLVFIISILLFGVHVYGSPLLMIFVLFLGVMAFTGLGILATSFVGDQESAQLIIMMIQFPMIFLSGVLYPLIQLPVWLRTIAYFLPLTYVVSAFRAVMILDVPFYAISRQIYILSIFTVAVFILALSLFERSVTK